MGFWSRLLPSSSSSAATKASELGLKGNKWKRWIRFQQSLNKKRWFELDREKNGPITLFDFAHVDDAIDVALVDETSKNRGWRISDDSVIGGSSHATMELIRNRSDYQWLQQGESPSFRFLQQQASQGGQRRQDPSVSKSNVGDENQQEEEPFVPFARWKGTIDTRVNKDHSDVQRSGFCTIRSPEFPFGGADLGGRYNALEIMCRSDGRPYSLNMKVDTFIPEDLFQTFINIPPTIPLQQEEAHSQESSVMHPSDPGGRFDKVILLFQHFIVTAGGRMRANQRDLDNSVRIETIGLTLMDGADGDFQFDLARIRAVNYDETGVIGQVD